MNKLNIQLFAEGEEKDEQEQIYLDQIEDLKNQMQNNMISKEVYDKLLKDHKKLLDDYVNRRPAPKVEVKETRKASEVAKELIKVKNRDITNRDYIAKTLEYREAHLKEFGTDPFTDFGQNGPQKPTDDTNMVASTLKTLLDENPSPVDFRIKLNSVLQDDPQLMAKLRKRA
jgi:predicted CopG family antitoxin